MNILRHKAFLWISSSAIRISSRNFSTTQKHDVKVIVAGAAGGIGQPLSLLLKLSPMVEELILYDLKHTLGVTTDLSHLETPAKCIGYNGVGQLKEAFKDAEIIVITAGASRKPGMTRDDLFAVNASVIKEMADVTAEMAPSAMVAIITNPINSCVPIFCKTMEKYRKLNPNKVFGVSTLDIVRSNTFVAEVKKMNPMDIKVPVVGGHAGSTIIPLFSQAHPKVDLTQDVIEQLTKRVQDAGTEVVKAKAGSGSATLAMAYAGARFTLALIRGMKGEANVVECAYVQSTVTPSKYYSTPLLLGKDGIQKNLGIPKNISPYEYELVKQSYNTLKKNIEKGEKFATS